MSVLRYLATIAILVLGLGLPITAVAVTLTPGSSRVTSAGDPGGAVFATKVFGTPGQSSVFAALRFDRTRALTVPEPASLVMLGGGLSALAALAKKRRKI